MVTVAINISISKKISGYIEYSTWLIQISFRKEKKNVVQISCKGNLIWQRFSGCRLFIFYVDLETYLVG